MKIDRSIGRTNSNSFTNDFFLHGNLNVPVQAPYDMLCSNPPPKKLLREGLRLRVHLFWKTCTNRQKYKANLAKPHSRLITGECLTLENGLNFFQMRRMPASPNTSFVFVLLQLGGSYFIAAMCQKGPTREIRIADLRA